MSGRLKSFVRGRALPAALVLLQLVAVLTIGGYALGSSRAIEARTAVDRGRLAVYAQRTAQMAVMSHDLARICTAVSCAP